MPVRTILIAGLAAIALTLGAVAPALAASGKPDKCDWAEYRGREKRMESRCFREGPYFCNNLAATAANRDELRLRMLRHQACAKAREEINACFSGAGPVNPRDISGSRMESTICERKLSQIH
ncbi:MAG: hypothetical protein E7812_17805 [Phenylobacterium sp.]|nr:MAG: hypothetical protein E7812_17805 [Phenylobacterium sp.]